MAKPPPRPEVICYDVLIRPQQTRSKCRYIPPVAPSCSYRNLFVDSQRDPPPRIHDQRHSVINDNKISLIREHQHNFTGERRLSPILEHKPSPTRHNRNSIFSQERYSPIRQRRYSPVRQQNHGLITRQKQNSSRHNHLKHSPIVQHRPIIQPRRSPIRQPIQSPIRQPIQSPIRKPIQSPIRQPRQSPISQHMHSPIKEQLQKLIEELNSVKKAQENLMKNFGKSHNVSSNSRNPLSSISIEPSNSGTALEEPYFEFNEDTLEITDLDFFQKVEDATMIEMDALMGRMKSHLQHCHDLARES